MTVSLTHALFCHKGIFKHTRILICFSSNALIHKHAHSSSWLSNTHIDNIHTPESLQQVAADALVLFPFFPHTNWALVRLKTHFLTAFFPIFGFLADSISTASCSLDHTALSLEMRWRPEDEEDALRNPFIFPPPQSKINQHQVTTSLHDQSRDFHHTTKQWEISMRRQVRNLQI